MERAAAADAPRVHPAEYGARGGVVAVLPPCFFAVAALSFGVGLIAAPFVAGQLFEHFYHPHVLALTHVFTLGWASAAILGVLYRYVPALVKGGLPFPRVAVIQLVTFVAGAAILTTGFWRGDWPLVACAAATLVVSAALVCANLWPLVLASRTRGVAEIGIVAATFFFVVAASLGFVLALDKTIVVLGGGLHSLGGHAAIAAIGWVGIIACSLSFRFLPAFLFPEEDRAPAARRQVIALAVAVPILAAALLGRSSLVAPAAIAVAAIVALHAWLLLQVIASHRLPLDWTAWHATAGVVWLLAAIGGGMGLAGVGAQSEIGARLAAVYGIAGLLGWISNLIMGVSYKLFPAFVLAARAELGRDRVPLAAVALPEPIKPCIFLPFNIGLAIAVPALLAGGLLPFFAGSGLVAIGGALYAAATLRTLGFSVLEPRRSSDPLVVIS